MNGRERIGEREHASQIDMEQALLDPASVFATPERLVRQEGLSRENKLEILRRWAYDASEDAVAREEGMPDGNDNLLPDVLRAIRQLSGEIDLEQSAPTKQRGIPRQALKTK